MFTNQLKTRLRDRSRLMLAGWMAVATLAGFLLGCDMGTYNQRFEEHITRTETSTSFSTRPSE